MFSLEIHAPQEQYDLLIAELWDLGSCGITESGTRLRAFFEDNARMAELLRRFTSLDPQAHDEDERDWVEVSRMMWEPVAVGRRFFLLPDWRDDPPPAGRVPIKINPGLACGTGWHEATQLCLEALERHVRPGTAVLDVGAGAGILSVAAALLGAGCVAACDIDAEAVAVARRRLAAHSAGVHLFLGSAEAIRAESCDVVVANINAATVIELAGEFWRSLRPGGVLLVCGFEGWEFPAVNRAVAHLRPESLARMDKDEWTLIEAQKAESHR